MAETPRYSRLLAVLLLVAPTGEVFAGDAPPFSPPLERDGAALAPDGVHVAYLRGEPEPPRLVIVSLDRPDEIAAADLPEWMNTAAQRPGAARLVWLDARRVLAVSPKNQTCCYDVSGHELGDRTSAPAFDPSDALPPGSDLQQIRTLLEEELPHRSITLLGCDRARQRFLLLATAHPSTTGTPKAGRDSPLLPPADAGRYFVYDQPHDLLYDLGPRQPAGAPMP